MKALKNLSPKIKMSHKSRATANISGQAGSLEEDRDNTQTRSSIATTPSVACPRVLSSQLARSTDKSLPQQARAAAKTSMRTDSLSRKDKVES